MEFWKMCWDYKAITLEMLKEATITETNPYGNITKEEFKKICNLDYDEA